MKGTDFDIIVVGAGHAGIEACCVAAKRSLKVALVTKSVRSTGVMSCNPSVGGLAKGHMVKELDALGGQMAKIADNSTIQFKKLNARKGPAVRGSRAQCDKSIYSQKALDSVRNHKNIHIIESEVKGLILKGSECLGVTLEDGTSIAGKKVIITTGTFMHGVMYIGTQKNSRWAYQ